MCEGGTHETARYTAKYDNAGDLEVNKIMYAINPIKSVNLHLRIHSSWTHLSLKEHCIAR